MGALVPFLLLLACLAHLSTSCAGGGSPPSVGPAPTPTGWQEEGPWGSPEDCWDPSLGHLPHRHSNLDPHCPGSSPATWQQQHLGLAMDCRRSSATFHFDLSLFVSVGWLKDVEVTVTREHGAVKETVKEIRGSSTKEVQLDRLCPGTQYFICLNFNPRMNERRNIFCEVRAKFWDDAISPCRSAGHRWGPPPPTPRASR